jgi:hypothetical protein
VTQGMKRRVQIWSPAPCLPSWTLLSPPLRWGLVVFPRVPPSQWCRK